MFFHKKSKNAAKMNKIVQKWQFWMTFYATMEMEVGLSLNGAKKWFLPYWFLIAQHIKYPKIIMRAPVHFFWVEATSGLQCIMNYYVIRKYIWMSQIVNEYPLRISILDISNKIDYIPKYTFTYQIFGKSHYTFHHCKICGL